jgi:Fe-coproporphyrin III synthase
MTLAQTVQDPPLERLPLVTLYLTDRCNSRCVSCDYWRTGRTDLTTQHVERLLPSLKSLGASTALLSGGEPLANPQWDRIARLLRAQGMRCWLLTAGLALLKNLEPAAELLDALTVSLDGAVAETYARIRGVNAFVHVLKGIEAAVSAGIPVSLRVTLQRANYRELAQFVALASSLGVRQVSFLAVDVANSHAFARTGTAVTQAAQLALQPEDLPILEEGIAALERTCARDFASGLIAESPAKLRRILQYFSAVCGLAPYPRVRCNAPEFSAVIDAHGRLQPCFFIPGPTGASAGEDVSLMLNDSPMRQLRADIRLGRRRECATCVCSMWRAPDAPFERGLLPAQRTSA